jgi:hypothetical protein
MENIVVSNQHLPGQENNLLAEIQIILIYVINRGIKIPDSISNVSLSNDSQHADPAILLADYNALVTAILPATPESIKYIGKEFTGNIAEVTSWKIPVVKKYIALSLFALAGIIGFSLLPDVTAANQEKGILSLTGMVLLENLFVIFFASLLGVMFYILKSIKDKVDNFTLTQVDVFSFNISIMIGVVSGFIISELFTLSQMLPGSSVEVNKMTLALLGGFSSDAIFSILQGAVNKIKSFFSGT